MTKICLVALVMFFLVCGLVHASGPSEYYAVDSSISEHAPNYVYNQSNGNYTIFVDTNSHAFYTGELEKLNPGELEELNSSFGLDARYFEYNETIDPYAKLFRLYYIIGDQMDPPRSTDNTYNINKNEYLNAIELQNALGVCNRALQHGQDLLNQTVVLYDQRNLEECVKAYFDYLKVDAVTPMILQTRVDIVYALSSLNVYGSFDYDRRAEQDSESYANDFKYKSTEATRCVINIISDIQAAKEEAAYKNWINITGIEVEPGNYEGATKITAPLGNYIVSFETRTPRKMSIDNTTISTEAGSGKEYHTEKFNMHVFKMPGDPSNFKIFIAEYIGSAKYTPTMPFDGYDEVNKKNYETLSSSSIRIDGHAGQMDESYNKKNEKYKMYAITYALDSNTFVMIVTDKLNYDKDVSLLIETLQMKKK